MWSPQKAERGPITSKSHHSIRFSSPHTGCRGPGLGPGPFSSAFTLPRGNLPRAQGFTQHASAHAPARSTRVPAWHLALLTARQDSVPPASLPAGFSSSANAPASTGCGGQQAGLILEASSLHSPKSNCTIGPADMTSKTCPGAPAFNPATTPGLCCPSGNRAALRRPLGVSGDGQRWHEWGGEAPRASVMAGPLNILQRTRRLPPPRTVGPKTPAVLRPGNPAPVQAHTVS